MNKHNICLLSAFILFFIFFIPQYSSAFKAEVLPHEINPGDAFLIKISGVKNTDAVTASLLDRQIIFSRCGDGCFIGIGAVELETAPGMKKIELNVGDKKKVVKLSVKHYRFPTLKLTLPEHKVFLSPEDLKRALEEEEKLKSIWQMTTNKLWEGHFIMPLDNKISTAYGLKRIINKKKISFHKGIDIKGRQGEEVKASNRGRVVLAEEFFFGGNTVVIDHGMGIYTVYMHLDKFNVKHGDTVSKGDIIGYVGSSGRSSGPHLHFGVKLSNISINPVSIVNLGL
jgi:murein DD-endopeptidase MepM/ murein hydrolase activator NlpD